jgi:hypothetical protein
MVLYHYFLEQTEENDDKYVMIIGSSKGVQTGNFVNMKQECLSLHSNVESILLQFLLVLSHSRNEHRILNTLRYTVFYKTDMGQHLFLPKICRMMIRPIVTTSNLCIYLFILSSLNPVFSIWILQCLYMGTPNSWYLNGLNTVMEIMIQANKSYLNVYMLNYGTLHWYPDSDGFWRKSHHW